MLTIHLITKNNESTIEQTLNSVLPLNAEIIIGDLGSNDRTIEICEQYGARISSISALNGLDKARNDLLGNEWNFFIEPWEVLVSGHDDINKIQTNGSFLFKVFKDNIVTKEIRLWNNELKFQNPVFETLIDDSANDLSNATIYSKQIISGSEKEMAINKWIQQEPLNLKPIYYKAFYHLSKNEINDFINLANRYLLLNNNATVSSIMLRYYLAISQLHYNNYSDSSKHCLCCILAQPLMAEFWCHLGDIYYKCNKYDKAKAFYENALLLGSRRLVTDKWPMIIEKYKTYPEQMIKSCESILQQTKLFRQTN